MGWFSKKPDDNTPIQLMNDNWSMYFKWTGENEEYPMMCFIDETYSEKTPDDYKEGVVFAVYLVHEGITENGMPLPETNTEMQKREEELFSRIEAARIHAKLPSRWVGIGRKSYTFQTRDSKSLIPILEAWADSNPLVRKKDISTDKGWGAYERLKPNVFERMQMEDMQVINTLLAQGLNEEEMHPLDFNFSGPADKLDIIQKDLEEENFVAVHREPNRMTMQKPLPLDLQTVWQCTQYMKMSGMAHECSYDGWGCRVK